VLQQSELIKEATVQVLDSRRKQEIDRYAKLAQEFDKEKTMTWLRKNPGLYDTCALGWLESLPLT
jgi:hypothetical protein